MKAVIEWRKNNIWLWAVGGRGKWITHIFYVPVVFLLQCDSESDIDDKVRLPFLCLLTCQLKRLRVIWITSDITTKEGVSQETWRD